jgi:hypothetical protein
MAGARLLFIIGTGRCGSTMTHEVLARHPDTGFISNLDANLPALNLRGRWNSGLLAFTPQALTQRDSRVGPLVKLRARFGPAEAYALLNRHVSALLSESVRDLTAGDVTPPLRSRMTDFYERRIAAQQKRVFLSKFSGWPRARFLHEIFADARFVHVMRDGRGVAESMIRRSWWRGYMGPQHWQYGPLSEEHERVWVGADRSYIVLAGLQWMMLMDAFDAARAAIPSDRWLEVRYEDLVADARARFGEILAFAGLEWTRAFDRRFAKYRFVPERRDVYRNRLTPDQLDALNEIMGEHLRAHGYDVAAR